MASGTTTVRDKKGRFIKGNPGGKKGRGKTIARTKILASLERIGVGEDEFIDNIVRRAHEEGDKDAVHFVLDKLLPRPKATQEPISFKMTGGSLSERAESVLQAASDGDLAIDQAAQIINALSSLGALVEIDQLEARLSRLENAKT